MNLNEVALRLRALLFRRRVEAELEEELGVHLELQTRKYVEAGMSIEDAVRRARLDFGAHESAKEECRDARRVNLLSHAAQDVHYSIRTFRREPLFTIFVIVILALSMGANLSTFSVTDAIMLRMLPVKDPASLFRMTAATGSSDDAGSGASYPVFRKMQKRGRALADLMAYQPADLAPVSISHFEQERLMQQTVSCNYFAVLGVQPVVGRMISQVDNAGPQAVAVISYRLWKTRFNKSPAAIGSKLRFGGHALDIIGVAPAQFFGVEVGKIVDVWTPLSLASATSLSDDHDFWLRPMGRLKAAVTIAQAAAPMQAVMNEAMLEDVRLNAPPGTPKQVIDRFLAGMRIKGVPAGGGISYLRRHYQQALEIMMFLGGLVMLIACSNVANLLIARGSARRREIAIRLALGAGKARILRQFLTESLLLAIIAAAGGLLCAQWSLPFLVRLLTPSSEPANLVTPIDLRLLDFTTLLMLSTVLVCGLLPALRFASADIYASLKGGLRLTVGDSGRAGRLLVTAQVALSVVLVVGAGLFTRTLSNLLSSYLGFNPAKVLVARITVQSVGNGSSLMTAWDELLRGVNTFPGVEDASLSSIALFAGDSQSMGIRTTAAKALPPDPLAGVSFIATRYFSTLGVGFVSGRDFALRDQIPGGPPVAIVNRAFARKFFGDENPIGRKLTKMANSPDWTEIVGIVENTKVNNLRDAAPPAIYVPFGRMSNWLPPQAHPGASLFLQVRGHLDEVSLAADLRRKARPQLAIGTVFRQRQLIDDTLVRERLLAKVGILFGVLALVLAAMGLYGIMSYAVAQRRQELGVRMALGAEPRAILQLMLKDSATVVGLGIVAGLLTAAPATRWTSALLYGLAPNDPKTFLAASLLLLSASLVAAFVPAYRAAKADPMIALRHE